MELALVLFTSASMFTSTLEIQPVQPCQTGQLSMLLFCLKELTSLTALFCPALRQISPFLSITGKNICPKSPPAARQLPNTGNFW